MQTAFLFIKPHAVNEKVINYVTTQLEQANYTISSTGNISSSQIQAGDLATA